MHSSLRYYYNEVKIVTSKPTHLKVKTKSFCDYLNNQSTYLNSVGNSSCQLADWAEGTVDATRQYQASIWIIVPGFLQTERGASSRAGLSARWCWADGCRAAFHCPDGTLQIQYPAGLTDWPMTGMEEWRSKPGTPVRRDSMRENSLEP